MHMARPILLLKKDIKVQSNGVMSEEINQILSPLKNVFNPPV